jgi:hypothetical protein
MRRTLTALLIVLLLVPELPARSNRDWETVKKLKPGTPIEVLLWSGENLRGEIDGVSDAGLQLAMAGSNGPGVGRLRQFDRTSIRRIVLIRKLNLPDSKRWMVTGAVAGGAIGFTAGAVTDLKQGGNYHWFEGALGGAAMGFFVSCAALFAAGVVDVARGSRHHKVVYEDKSIHPPHS